MRLAMHILGSGSRGNAMVIAGLNGGVLLDAGFSRRELVSRMKDAGIEPESIQAAVLTHEHDDHVKGCRVFCDAYDIPAYVSERTAAYLERLGKLPRKYVLFAPGTPFGIGDFEFSPFPVQHDAVEPVGFVVSAPESARCGIATDLGQLNRLALTRLRDCDVLVLEANYDLNMLHESDRSRHLKHRIMGRHGHLDNRDALEAFAELITERTRAVYLVHVSGECNRYDLVRELAEARLRELALGDRVVLHVAEQERPAPGFQLYMEGMLL